MVAIRLRLAGQKFMGRADGHCARQRAAAQFERCRPAARLEINSLLLKIKSNQIQITKCSVLCSETSGF